MFRARKTTGHFHILYIHIFSQNNYTHFYSYIDELSLYNSGMFSALDLPLKSRFDSGGTYIVYTVDLSILTFFVQNLYILSQIYFSDFWPLLWINILLYWMFNHWWSGFFENALESAF